MYSLHIRKNRKISLYHDTAMEVDMDMPYSVRGSREHYKFMIYCMIYDPLKCKAVKLSPLHDFFFLIAKGTRDHDILG